MHQRLRGEISVRCLCAIRGRLLVACHVSAERVEPPVEKPLTLNEPCLPTKHSPYSSDRQQLLTYWLRGLLLGCSSRRGVTLGVRTCTCLVSSGLSNGIMPVYEPRRHKAELCTT